MGKKSPKTKVIEALRDYLECEGCADELEINRGNLIKMVDNGFCIEQLRFLGFDTECRQGELVSSGHEWSCYDCILQALMTKEDKPDSMPWR